MKFTSTLIAGLAAVGSVSAVPWGWGGWGNNQSPIPGYPQGNGWCLTDQQATFLVNQFSTMLTSTSRQVQNSTAQALLDTNYVETSDSINILAGFPLGGPSFTPKSYYIYGILFAPPIGSMTNLEVYHDCTRITWRWNAVGVGSGKYPVKGISSLTVTSPAVGTLASNNLEFSSVAWGEDTGWTCTAPPSNGSGPPTGGSSSGGAPSGGAPSGGAPSNGTAPSGSGH